LGRQQ